MGSSAPVPTGTPGEITTTLAEIVAGHARDHGAAIAVQDAAGALSYAELTRLAGRVGELSAQFVAPDRPIGILLAPSADYVAAILGLLARGICYVPLDASFPAARNAEIAARADMSAVIVDETSAAAMSDSVPDIPRVMMPKLEACAGATFRVTATPDDLAAIFYTSGSTGRPKGVFQSQRAILYEVLRHCWRAGLQRGEGIALIYSPSVSGATRDLYGSLAAGARLVVADVRSQGLTRAATLFADGNVTVLHIIPGLFRAMFGEPIGAAADRLLRGLRLVHLISDRVQQTDVALFRRCFPAGCRLCIDLATTETYSYASWYPDHGTAIERLLVPVGYPRADAPLRLIDAEGAEVAPGELGEIVVSSRSLSLGYWRDPAMTAERFKPSASLPGAREFHTGDMGRLLPDGLLEFVGRKDRQTKIRGNTVHLAEIEAALAACPGVAEAVALVRAGGDPAIVSYYVAKAGASAHPAALARWCAERLPAHMRPSEMIARDALPRLPSGKPDLVALGHEDEQRARAIGAPEGRDSLPVSGIEQVVRESWERILGPGSFDANVTFESAGGDSLKGLNLVVELERRLDRLIDWEVLDFRTTPAMLTARLTDTAPEPASGGPLLVLYPGIFGGDVVIADFARRASRHFAPMIADYRWGGDWFNGDFDSERMLKRIVSAVVERIGPGPSSGVWLLGNSFGGKIAVETARRLMARGIAVDFIGVLDSVPGNPLAEWGGAPGQIPRSSPQRRLEESVRRLGAWLANGDRHRLASYLLRFIRLTGRAGLELSLRREITWHARVAQFGDVPGGRVAGRLSLFLSNETRFDPAIYPYLGWDQLFDEIDVIAMDVAHSEFMNPANADGLIEHLLASAAGLALRSAECETT